MQVAQHGLHLLAADMFVQLELPLAEELGVPELARLAPVRAVGRPEHVGVVVEQVPANVEPRPVDKRLVVALEDKISL